MFRTMKLGFCVVALLGMPATLCAASIPWLVDTNTNAVIFDDNYESPLGVVGNQPVAAVGSWSFPGVTATVSDLASAGFAANEGSQFVKVTRSGSQEMFGAGVTANSGAGNDIVLTLAFRGVPNADGNFGVLDSSLAGWPVIADVLINGNGGVLHLDSDAVAFKPLTQTYNVNAWNTAVITHTNGTSVYMLSINGQTPESVGRFAAVNSNADGVYIASASSAANPLYFDSLSVPEPSTIYLFIVGLIGLTYAGRRSF